MTAVERSDIRRDHKNPDHFQIALVLAIAFSLVAEFLSGIYETDIDHEIYFGQRLFAGELLWTVEYHDKLPVVQWLFAIPAYFESVQVWRVFSLGSCLGAAWAISTLLPKVSGLQGPWPLRSSHLSLIFVLAMILLPDSITHFNCVAASFAVTGILIFCRNPTFGFGFLGAAALAALAISIRPYLLLPILAVAVWFGLRTADSVRSRIRPMLRLLFIWAASIAAFGFFFNAGAYVASGNMASFWAGIQVLAQETTPQSAYSILKAQAHVIRAFPWLTIATTFAVIAWSALAILAVRRRINQLAIIDFFFVAVAFPLLLQLAIFSKHFWDGYMSFVFPFGMLAAYFCVAHLETVLKESENRKILHGLMIFGSVLFVIATLPKSLLDTIHASTRKGEHRTDAEFSFLRNFLTPLTAEERKFLVPSDMYPHWKLRETRRGFPHAANIDHIAAKSWWTRVIVPGALDIPTDYRTLCEKIRTDAPNVVAEWESQPLYACLSSSESGYMAATDLPLPDKKDRFVIFVKQRPLDPSAASASDSQK